MDYLPRASRTTFLKARTRLKQSGQTNRIPLPSWLRDSGRMVADSTSRLHSGHTLIFEGSLPTASPRRIERRSHMPLSYPFPGASGSNGAEWRGIPRHRRAECPAVPRYDNDLHASRPFHHCRNAP